MVWVLLYYIHNNETKEINMYKVIYHYEVRGEAKSFVADVFMTLEKAREYILDQFDCNVDRNNEHDDNSYLDEGRLAEIHREIIEKHYEIEYVAKV